MAASALTTGRRRASAAMVHRDSNPGEGGLLVDLADCNAVGLGVDGRQIRPSSSDRGASAERAGSIDHGVGDRLSRARILQASTESGVS
jgi:hypothetical protein